MTSLNTLTEKYPVITELTQGEQQMLFATMSAFQDAAQQTLANGEELLKMCDGCAFKKGSEANNHPITSLEAIGCVIQREPFYCHKRFCPDGSKKLCNGWINVMNNK